LLRPHLLCASRPDFLGNPASFKLSPCIRFIATLRQPVERYGQLVAQRVLAVAPVIDDQQGVAPDLGIRQVLADPGPAGRRGGQAVSRTIVTIRLLTRCGAGRGIRSSKDTRRLTGLFWLCATRDTRRLVLPGQMHKTGIGILSGCGFGQPLLPLPSLAPEAVSRCPAFGSCRPRAFRPWRHAMWAGRDKGRAL